MIYSLLIVAIAAGGVYWWKRREKLPEAKRKSLDRKILIWGGAAAVLILVLMGRAPWLLGVIAALLAIATRLVQFVPLIAMFRKAFGQDQVNQSSRQPAAETEMNRKQAADILGVEVTATDAEVREAHKRLMQKIHPDRGGSDGLAKQINRAKDIMLGS